MPDDGQRAGIQRLASPQLKTSKSIYPLRLPTSIEAEAVRLAVEEGTGLNQFVATAVAEKVASLRTADFFLTRKSCGNREAFRLLMTRTGGALPQPGEELPEVESYAPYRIVTLLSVSITIDSREHIMVPLKWDS